MDDDDDVDFGYCGDIIMKQAPTTTPCSRWFPLAEDFVASGAIFMRSATFSMASGKFQQSGQTENRKCKLIKSVSKNEETITYIDDADAIRTVKFDEIGAIYTPAISCIRSRTELSLSLLPVWPINRLYFGEVHVSDRVQILQNGRSSLPEIANPNGDFIGMVGVVCDIKMDSNSIFVRYDNMVTDVIRFPPPNVATETMLIILQKSNELDPELVRSTLSMTSLDNWEYIKQQKTKLQLSRMNNIQLRSRNSPTVSPESRNSLKRFRESVSSSSDMKSKSTFKIPLRSKRNPLTSPQPIPLPVVSASISAAITPAVSSPTKFTRASPSFNRSMAAYASNSPRKLRKRQPTEPEIQISDWDKIALITAMTAVSVSAQAHGPTKHLYEEVRLLKAGKIGPENMFGGERCSTISKAINWFGSSPYYGSVIPTLTAPFPSSSSSSTTSSPIQYRPYDKNSPTFVMDETTFKENCRVFMCDMSSCDEYHTPPDIIIVNSPYHRVASQISEHGETPLVKALGSRIFKLVVYQKLLLVLGVSTIDGYVTGNRSLFTGTWVSKFWTDVIRKSLERIYVNPTASLAGQFVEFMDEVFHELDGTPLESNIPLEIPHGLLYDIQPKTFGTYISTALISQLEERGTIRSSTQRDPDHARYLRNLPQNKQILQLSAIPSTEPMSSTKPDPTITVTETDLMGPATSRIMQLRTDFYGSAGPASPSKGRLKPTARNIRTKTMSSSTLVPGRTGTLGGQMDDSQIGNLMAFPQNRKYTREDFIAGRVQTISDHQTQTTTFSVPVNGSRISYRLTDSQ